MIEQIEFLLQYLSLQLLQYKSTVLKLLVALFLFLILSLNFAEK